MKRIMKKRDLSSKTRVQSLLFCKTRFKYRSDARAWAKRHGYSYGKIHETKEKYRIRQIDPEKFSNMFTITFTPGVKAIIGKLK